MPSNTPAIRACGLGKAYRLDTATRHDTLRDLLMARLRGHPPRPVDDFWALRDVSFTIPRGETVGIIGRNGSGKSTLLRLLARITPPTEGEAAIRGRIAALLDVGTGFHPELSGLENIRLNAAILGVPRRRLECSMDGIIEFAGVGPHLHEPLKRYSAGMRTRLGFAVAAHVDPDVLIVDEVLAVADANFQERCFGIMRAATRRGATVLIVSHDSSAIRALCNRVLWLEGGHLREDSRDVPAALGRYHSAEGAATAVWAAPDGHHADAPFAPVRLAVAHNADEAGDADAPRGAAVHLLIEGEVRVEDPDLEVGYALRGGDGQIILLSLRADADGALPLPPGPVALRTRLPTEILNAGTHTVELVVRRRGSAWAIAPGADAPRVSFHIEPPAAAAAAWPGGRPGLIAPNLPWTTIQGTRP